MTYTDSTGTLYTNMDYISRTEVGTIVAATATDARTYAAITSRSYHPGVVNTLLGDGSVRTIADSISQKTWRALGTRAGRELVGDF